MHKEIRNLMNWSICGYSSHTTRNELGTLCQWRQDRCVKNSLQFSQWLETAALKRFLVFWVMVRRWTTTESRWLTRRLYDWLKMCYQSFVLKSAASSIRSGLQYLLSLGFVSFSSFYMPQEMLKVVHPNQITQEKFIIECPKKNIADVLLRRCIKKEKFSVFQVDLCPPVQIKLSFNSLPPIRCKFILVIIISIPIWIKPSLWLISFVLMSFLC